MTKKSILTSLVMLLLAFAYGKSANASSFNFVIQGDIPGVCEVVNISVNATTTLDLGITTEQLLGELDYTCSVNSGFTREIRSFNGGNLVSGGQQIAYQVSHTGKKGLAFTATQLTSPLIQSFGGGGFNNGESGNISVTVPFVANDLFAGTYSDTITIVMTAN